MYDLRICHKTRISLCSNAADFTSYQQFHSSSQRLLDFVQDTVSPPWTSPSRVTDYIMTYVAFMILQQGSRAANFLLDGQQARSCRTSAYLLRYSWPLIMRVANICEWVHTSHTDWQKPQQPGISCCATTTSPLTTGSEMTRGPYLRKNTYTCRVNEDEA